MKKIIKDKKSLTIFFLSLLLLLSIVRQLALKRSINQANNIVTTQSETVGADEMPNNQEQNMNPVLQPFIWNSGRKLTTPLMSKNSGDNFKSKINIYQDNYTTPYRIEFNVFEGWEYEDYNFKHSYDHGTIPSYYVIVRNSKNPEYNLTFSTFESEFSKCDFNNKFSNESNFQINIFDYITVNTDFGVLRVGNTDLESFPRVVCQSNVTGLDNQTSDWVSFTNIGDIIIKTPPSPDNELYLDMIEMLKLIKVAEYAPKP